MRSMASGRKSTFCNTGHGRICYFPGNLSPLVGPNFSLSVCSFICQQVLISAFSVSGSVLGAGEQDRQVLGLTDLVLVAEKANKR